MNSHRIGEALRGYAPWAPDWLVTLLLVAVALSIALGLHRLVVSLARKRLTGLDTFWRSLVVRSEGPARLALIVAALTWAAHVAPLSDGYETNLKRLLFITFVGLLGWTGVMAVEIAGDLYLRRLRLDDADNLQARKHLTQMRILQRSADTMIIVISAGVALVAVPGVRQLGVSLLAAGGAAGIIVGLALQPILSNMMAGVQIAFTQPIRIDDAVKVEGQFGHVEEITSAYVVIKLWDLRRLVVPLKYFLEKPFENWTRQTSELIGEVELMVDYRVPVAELREELARILGASQVWDKRIGKLQVTAAGENVMTVRALVSAANASQLADLRFDVREKMITFLQDTIPDALPRKGVEFHAAPPEPDAAPPE
ncbi:mechanosensitive ion channel family protein [Phenylobacterium immobile]|uniref:mechanosensitive ion channel family protein n=1 Tax=Phenylobacterium immobile TaxID=21 RepID=UPI000AEBA69B|nr:mechanosensitive ion channel domain-containing protein [Phenylobacterium immobile]